MCSGRTRRRADDAAAAKRARLAERRPTRRVVPLLTGETERASQLRLAQDGLELVGAVRDSLADYASDVVVAQDPAAKTACVTGALLVNRGEQGASYVMPDLIGVDGDRAAVDSARHGFPRGGRRSSPYPGVAAGIVLRQSPQGGFQIAPGEPISLEVSR